jgi:uncharacterized membrane protein
LAFCSNCGTQATGAYCPNCGAAIAGGSGPTGTGSSYVPPSSSAGLQAPGLAENLASALCYLFGLITGIVFLVIAPYNQNKTIRFHAFQSIFLSVAVIIIDIFLSMLGFVTHGFGLLLFPLFGLLVFVVWLYMMFQAYNKRKVKLPVIGDLAEKQA